MSTKGINLVITLKQVSGIKGYDTGKDKLEELLDPAIMSLLFREGDKTFNSKAINGTKGEAYKEVLKLLTKGEKEGEEVYRGRIDTYIFRMIRYFKKNKSLVIKDRNQLLDDSGLGQTPDKRIEAAVKEAVHSETLNEKSFVLLILMSITRNYSDTKDGVICNWSWDKLLKEIILPESVPVQVVDTRLREIIYVILNTTDPQELMDCEKELYHVLADNKGDKRVCGQAEYYLSECYRKLDEHENAKVHFNKAIQYGNIVARLRQIGMYIEENKRPLAMKACKELEDETLSKAERGELYYDFYRLGKLRSDTDTDYESEKKESLKYLQKSAEYGYRKAFLEYQKYNRINLQYIPKPARETGRGTYFVCGSPRFCKMVEATEPTDWKAAKCDELEDFLLRELDYSRRQKIFLLSETEQENLSWLLQCLQKIKEIKEEKGITRWKLEIYIRGEAEHIGDLADTAIHHLEDVIIPIYIIDPYRMAAQKLLAEHPLFYPVRNLRYRNKVQTTLNFVVLGNSKTCQWMVREAFPLLASGKECYKTKITVLNSDPGDFMDELYLLCPGMKKEMFLNHLSSTDKTNAETLWDRFTEISSHNNIPVDFMTSRWLEELDKIYLLGKKENTKYYFAIDIGNDLENMRAAIQLREWTIRHAVAEGGRKEDFENLPVIAYRCLDNNIANLSRYMSIGNIANGDKWFNNYELVAFGSEKDSYSWAESDGGIWEQISLNVNMNYSGVTKESDLKAIDSAKWEYYSRTYNHESSFAVAVSMPYRLWESDYGEKVLYPEDWNILDKTAYADPEAIRSLCERFENGKATRKNASYETARLADWEQNRWARWMISKGYLTATVSQSQNYMAKSSENGKAGKRQLYIAKLHPGLTTYDNLYTVSKKLKIDLDNFNMKSIEHTSDMLLADWTKGEEE